MEEILKSKIGKMFIIFLLFLVNESREMRLTLTIKIYELNSICGYKECYYCS